MNYLLHQASALSAGKALQDDDQHSHGWCWGVIVIVFVVIVLVKYLFKPFSSKLSRSLRDTTVPVTLPTPKNAEAPKVNFPETTPFKTKPGLTLDSLNTPPATVSPSTTPTPSAPMPDSPPPPPAPSATPTVSVGPGDFEKALAHAGQRMDAMLAQTTELTRQLKLSEKAKTEATIALNQATESLAKQLEHKDAELSKLSTLLEQKSSYPSLRALIEVKKLCQDMLGTQKPLSHDDLIKFIADDIDNKLSGLDVQSIEFAPGTPLEKIPGEQVENSGRFEPTQDSTQVNQVARLLRPCYYIGRDSKRIIVAKASVVLYRLTPVTPTPTSSTPPTA